MKERIVAGEDYFQTLFDAVATPVFVVDKDLLIHDLNTAAEKLQGRMSGSAIKRLCGEVLHCVHDLESPEGCGTTPHCPSCILRKTAETVADNPAVAKKTAKLTLVRRGKEENTWFQITGAPLPYEGKNYIVITLEEITELVVLRNILPICMHCRKVRDDEDYWHQVDEYLHTQAQMQFSHGICPDCLQEHHPKHYDSIKEKLFRSSLKS